MTWSGVFRLCLPDTYGLKDTGHCGHCNGHPKWFAISEVGIFCCSCFRWCTYDGPPALFGDGMGRDRDA